MTKVFAFLLIVCCSWSDSRDSQPIKTCNAQMSQTEIPTCELSRVLQYFRIHSTTRLRGGSQRDSFQNPESAVLDFETETRDSIIGDHDRGQILDPMYQSAPRSPAELEQINEEARQKDSMRQSILSRILSKEARSRLGNIAAVKPDRARKIEDTFIEQARCGMILQQVTESDLIKTVDSITTKLDKRQEIRFARRRSLLDSLGLDPELAQRLGVKMDGWKADDWEELPDSDKEEWGDDLGPVGHEGKDQGGDEDGGGDEDRKEDMDGDAADGE